MSEKSDRLRTNAEQWRTVAGSVNLTADKERLREMAVEARAEADKLDAEEHASVQQQHQLQPKPSED